MFAPQILVRNQPQRTGGASWTPASVSTLFWYDADDGATITGDPCSQWNDKSGNGKHLTPAAGGSGFDVTAAVQNGKTGLLSTNNFTNARMATVSTFTQAQPFTVYLALKTEGSIGDFTELFSGENTGSGSRATLWAKRSDVGNDPCMGVTSIGSDLAGSAAYYISAVYDDASSAGFLNGVGGAIGSAGAFGIIGGIQLGVASAYYLEMFAVAGTGSERASAEAYLAAKWGI